MLRLVADALFVISAMKGRQTTRLGSVRTIFLHSAQTIAGHHRSEFKLFFLVRSCGCWEGKKGKPV